ncbi:MAG: RNA polymerase sigma-I factor [Clostridiales bacterium]|nr:RNA polymerase sigma-I factor [Clostridiales bacterium]
MKELNILEKRVYLAKVSNYEREKLIEEYNGFIMNQIFKKNGKYMSKDDDEYSIALMAFSEAIDRFDIERGSFLSYANLIISSRLTDYYRLEKKNGDIISIDFTSKNKKNESIQKDISLEKYDVEKENKLRKDEINILKVNLLDWKITMADLVKHSPKQEKLRNLYKKIAYEINESSDIKEELFKNRRLPIKKIQEIYPIPQKKLERGRIYIIALVIILDGDYEFIKEYIKWR